MKNNESKNLEAKKPIQVRLNPKEGRSSKEQNQKTDPEKTQEATSEQYANEYKNRYGLDPNDTKKGEEAEIIPQIDTIIQNNDKFETVKVIMEILCKELEIPKDSQFPVIAKALNGVWEQYWKSMEEWRNLVKMGKNVQ
ncbi:MAG: hypothetical protein [Microviridae sp.]|nr:MAG: hypothetical protein [Microviridae sp.]